MSRELERCDAVEMDNPESTSGTTIETPINSKELIGLNYPGVVKNPAKMLETLGGEAKLTKAFNDNHAPLALKFQPDNPYCKPARGVATRSTSLLMKVKHRYRRQREGEDGAHPGSEEYSAEVLGVIGQKYEFPYLCDFQYLPYDGKPGEEASSLIEKIVPSAGEDISYVDKDISSFMLPEMFSKFDKPIEYNYKVGQQLRPVRDQQDTDFQAKLIQHGRQKRTNFAHVISTMVDFEVPMEPHPVAVENLESQKPGTAPEEIRKLFERRPLWSRNALRCNTEVSTILIKGILCVVAYYFQQGPWRGLWCRIGYDPRQHPGAKNYQLLDFRIRKELTDKSVKLMLKKKRMILYPHQSLKNKRVVPKPVLSSSTEQEGSNRETFESYYIMRRGILPAYHQMFYQLCDLEDPELQAIINNPIWHKTKPNMKTGFFEAEMFRRLRDCLTQMIKDTVLEVNARKSLQDDSSQGSTPSTSASTPEMQGGGGNDEEEEETATGEGDEADAEDEEGLDREVIDVGREDDGEEMEEEDVLSLEPDGAEEERGREKDDKEVDEEVDSENEMAMEMLEFMDSSMLPS